MARALTARSVETIQPGAERAEIADAHLPGLYLVVQSTGTKSWAVRYRVGGRTRKHTIGSYPAIDLKNARSIAGKAMRAVAEGRDPGREKAESRIAKPDTVAAVVREFVERHCKANRTAAATQRLFELHVLPRWRSRLIGDISRRDVIELLDRIVDAGKPIAANRVLAAVRKLFNWCVARDIIVTSPAHGVKPPSTERPRDRVLSDAELANVWHAAGKLGGSFGALVKLLILLGQRRDECARMEWSEIDLEARLWKLPPGRVKSAKGHQIPLGEQACAILEALPRIGDGRYVLTTNGKAPSSNYSKGKARLDALLPSTMAGWRLHDIRRSCASGMAKIGIGLPTIERCLNHVSGSFAGIVGVYQRHSFSDEKRHAFERWGAHVADLVDGREQTNVVRRAVPQ